MGQAEDVWPNSGQSPHPPTRLIRLLTPTSYFKPDEEDWTAEETQDAIDEEKRLADDQTQLKNAVTELNSSQSRAWPTHLPTLVADPDSPSATRHPQENARSRTSPKLINSQRKSNKTKKRQLPA